MTEQSPENKKSKRKAPHPLFRLLDFAGPYKVLTVVGCALAGLHSLLAVMPLVCVWFIMSQFVAVAPQWSEASGAAFYAWLAVGFAVAGVVVYFAALMCTHIAAFRTGNNMRKAATHHLSKVPLGYYDEHSTGELRRVIDGCAGQTESVLAHKFPDFVGALVTPVVFVVVMFIFDWAMGLACLVPIAVSFACIWRMMGGGGSDENSSYLTFVSNYQQALNRMNAAATEYVRGMPVVKVFQQTVDSFNAFKEAILQYRDMAHGYSKLCEKPQVVQIVAINSNRIVWIVDASKLVDVIGKFPLPVEVIPFGAMHVIERMKERGYNPTLRLDAEGKPVRTDENNYVVDLHLERIDDPAGLNEDLINMVGVVEDGLFLDMVNEVIVGDPNGPRTLINPNKA